MSEIVQNGDKVEFETEITLTDLLNFNGIDDLNERADNRFLELNGDDVSICIEDISYKIVGHTDDSVKIKIHGTIKEL